MNVFNSVVKIVFVNPSDKEYSIDKLTLDNNFYVDEECEESIIVKVSSIETLIIYNIENYKSDIFVKLIDRVLDYGTIELNNIVLDKIDIGRFKNVIINGYQTSINEIYNSHSDCDEGTNNIGKLICKNISFQNDLIIDDGIYSGTFYFSIDNNIDKFVRNGYGTMKWNDGSYYEGMWSCDMKHGRGKMTYIDGSCFEGEWNNDERSDYGKMTYIDGSCYEGILNNNERNGYGIMKWNDGSCYEGGWCCNKRHGYGINIYKGGDIHQGEWNNDEKC